jgi:hypothetical protein
LRTNITRHGGLPHDACVCACARAAQVPKGTEASVFALVTSLQMVGGTAGGAISAVLTEALGVKLSDYSRLADLVWITSCVSSPPSLVSQHARALAVCVPSPHKLVVLVVLRHVPSTTGQAGVAAVHRARARTHLAGEGGHKADQGGSVAAGSHHGLRHVLCCLHGAVPPPRGAVIGCP